MNLALIDPNGSASILSAEGEIALREGDTNTASRKHEEAGRLIERAAKSIGKPADRTQAVYFAATQFYLAGRYPEAWKLAQRINPGSLPRHVRDEFGRFFAEVRERASADYPLGVRRRIQKAVEADKPELVLRLFRQHPFVMSPGGMALLRAMSCDSMRDFRAAARFYRDAWRYEERHPQMLALVAGAPVARNAAGDLAGARDLAARLVELIHHPVIAAPVSILRYHTLHHPDTGPAEREQLAKSIPVEMARTWNEFTRLPAAEQAEPNFIEIVTFGLVITGLAACSMGLPDVAAEFHARAMSIAPSDEGTVNLGRVISEGPKAQTTPGPRVEVADIVANRTRRVVQSRERVLATAM